MRGKRGSNYKSGHYRRIERERIQELEQQLTRRSQIEEKVEEGGGARIGANPLSHALYVGGLANTFLCSSVRRFSSRSIRPSHR